MKNESFNVPFPNNLFKDLGAEMPKEQPDDFIPTLLYVLRCVGSDNDATAVIMRYRYGESFDAIGEFIGLTRQRAHIIVQDTLARISPNYLDMLKYGMKKYMENMLDDRIKYLNELIVNSATEETKNACYKEGYEKGFADATANRKESSANRNTINNILVNTLSLSIRTFNACKRNHLNTVGDILDCGDNIMNCSYLGQSCFREIANKLEALNVNVSEYFPMTIKIWEVSPVGETV